MEIFFEWKNEDYLENSKGVPKDLSSFVILLGRSDRGLTLIEPVRSKRLTVLQIEDLETSARSATLGGGFLWGWIDFLKTLSTYFVLFL